MAIHGIRREPPLHYEFFGHSFSDDDKINLLSTGNMGRVVPLNNSKTGEIIPSIISVDRLTNELIALRTDKMKIPEEIKGVKLNEEQKQTLSEGKPLYLEGMISKKGAPFDAQVQFNAEKRFVEFLFDNKLTTLLQNQARQSTPEQELPRVLRGRELTDVQYDQLKDGKTLHLEGLIDKNEKPYQGYFTLNKETGKVEFSFKNPNKVEQEASQKEKKEKTNTPAKTSAKKM